MEILVNCGKLFKTFSEYGNITRYIQVMLGLSEHNISVRILVQKTLFSLNIYIGQEMITTYVK